MDVLAAVIVFSFEGEKMSRLWLLRQRIIYRQFMAHVLLKLPLKAIKDELTG